MRSLGNLVAATLLVAVAMPAAPVEPQEASQPPSDDDASIAVGCLRTINTAEVVYARTYRTGYSPTLAALSVPAEGTQYTASAAGLIDASLGSGKKNGYIFTYKPGKPDAQGQINTYTVTARPTKQQKGVQSFFIDQTAVLRWANENRAPTAKAPAL